MLLTVPFHHTGVMLSLMKHKKERTITMATRETKRSDGSIKVYSINKDGKLLTVVMKPKERGYTIATIKCDGKVTYFTEGWTP